MSTKSTRSFCQKLVWQKNSGGSYQHFDFPHGEKSLRGYFPTGIFPHRDYSPWGFFSAQYSSLEDLIQWQSIFSAFIHIYIVYGMDPAQLLHVVVKQAGKLYF